MWVDTQNASGQEPSDDSSGQPQGTLMSAVPHIPTATTYSSSTMALGDGAAPPADLQLPLTIVTDSENLYSEGDNVTAARDTSRCKYIPASSQGKKCPLPRRVAGPSRADETQQVERPNNAAVGCDEIVQRRRSARLIQRWYLHVVRLRAFISRIQRSSSHLDSILGASKLLGADCWATEWDSLCCDKAGLITHATNLLYALGLNWLFEGRKYRGIVSSEAILSALLTAAHPKVADAGFWASTDSKQKSADIHSDAQHGPELASAATCVRSALYELQAALCRPQLSSISILGSIDRLSSSLLDYVNHQTQSRRHHHRSSEALADTLTAAVADLLETVVKAAHTQRQSYNDREVEIVLRAGLHRLQSLERDLVRVVGQVEACRRVKSARVAARQRLRVDLGSDWLRYNPVVQGRSQKRQRGAHLEVRQKHVPRPERTVQQHGCNEDTTGQTPFAEADSTLPSTTVSQIQTSRPDSKRLPGLGRQIVALDEASDRLFSNLWLVHEICLQPPGKFLQVSLEDTYSKTNESVQDTYWASVTRVLLSGDHSPLLILVQELLERLISTTPSRQDLAKEAREALDVTLLTQLLSYDLLDSRPFFSLLRFAGRRILFLEAPARNSSTETWLGQLNHLEQHIRAQAGAAQIVRLSMSKIARQMWCPMVSPLFKFLLDKIDQIHVDTLNSHLRRAAPICRAHGPHLELERFQDQLAVGHTGLCRTKEWLARTLGSAWCQEKTMPLLNGKASSQNISLSQAILRNREDALRVFMRRAYCDLLSWPVADGEIKDRHGSQCNVTWTTQDVPETLAMDVQRLEVAQHALLTVARASGLAAMMKQLAGEKWGVEQRTEAIKSLTVLLPDEETTVEHIQVQVMTVVEKALDGRLSETVRANLAGRVERLMSGRECPVLALLYTRAIEALYAYMEMEDLELAEVDCASRGLANLSGWIARVADLVLLVCSHNEQAFLPMYHKLVLEVMQAQDDK